MSNEKPKPCPFCGSDKHQIQQWYGRKYLVWCLSCGCYGPPGYKPDNAISLWNTRPKAEVREK
jgi:uncharacterized Zn finger protein